ncbi:MAG: SDR family oxidoreductase [Bacteriovoracaceae bacterium]|nr:SDR family oxidoreductase [Bacteriovoracaceae bacterium]
MLDLKGKTFLITGVANKKSLAYHVVEKLQQAGAHVIASVQNEEIKNKLTALLPQVTFFLCDVTKEKEIQDLATSIKNKNFKLDGFVHSIAFANFQDGIKPFHETNWNDFQSAAQISCFSLTQMSQALKDLFTAQASVVTISISNTKATAYGYLGPIKAMLESSISYLAKSFSTFSDVRFNAVGAGPLKTSASAGIPGYIDNYLYAEELTLRKKALTTTEVANSVLFLLSPLSSGINGTTLLVDAGMHCNTFDQKVVKTFVSANLSK